jgi:hypothetical protein
VFDKIRDYLTPWQVPFILAFLAWWLVGAAWLLQRSLRKLAGLRNQALGPCALSLFLSGLGAAVVGGLTFLLVQRIGESPESHTDVRVLAIAPAVLLAVPMAFLILYAAFQLPVRLLLRVSWPAMASVAAAAVVAGVPAFWMGWSLRVDVGKAQTSVANLTKIDDAIRDYERDFEKRPPDNLMVLTKELASKGKKLAPLLGEASLKCPFLPDDNVGYFYYPVPSVDKGNRQSQKLRACEWTHPHSARYRAMLFANGDARFNPDEDFQRVLNHSDNADFARAFRAADANRR